MKLRVYVFCLATTTILACSCGQEPLPPGETSKQNYILQREALIVNVGVYRLSKGSFPSSEKDLDNGKALTYQYRTGSKVRAASLDVRKLSLHIKHQDENAIDYQATYGKSNFDFGLPTSKKKLLDEFGRDLALKMNGGVGSEYEQVLHCANVLEACMVVYDDRVVPKLETKNMNWLRKWCRENYNMDPVPGFDLANSKWEIKVAPAAVGKHYDDLKGDDLFFIVTGSAFLKGLTYGGKPIK